MDTFFRQKHTILVIDAIILFISVFGIYRAFHKAGMPVEFVYSEEGHVLVELVKESKSTGTLLVDDIILSVNGYPVPKIEDIEFICDGYIVGDIVKTKIVRNGNEQTVGVTLIDFYSNTYIILIGLLGLLFFSLGVFVLIRLPKKDEAYVYNWLSMSVVLVVTTTWGRFSVLPFALEHMIRIAFSAGYTFMPALFVHFSYIFPSKKPWIIKNFMPVLYALSVLLAGWQIITFLLAVNLSLIDWFHQFRIALNVSRWFLAGCVLYGIWNFFHSYFTTRQQIERRKLLWIILGLALGPFFSIAFWQIPQALFSRGLLPEEFVLVLLGTAPVAFSIAILRYRLLDIDLLFRRSSVYFFAISGLFVLYVGIVGTAAAIVAYLGMFTLKASLISSAIAAIITAILFEPVRKRIQDLVDKQFFRVRYNYRTAQNRFMKRINQSYDVSHIIEFTVEELDQLLHPRCIAFYLRSRDGSDWHRISERNWKFGDESLIEYLAAEFFQSSQIISLQEYIEADISFHSADPEIFHKNKVALAISCQEKSLYSSGFLILGRKKDTPIFTQEDVDLLRTVASHLGLAIEHIRLQQKLLLEKAEAQRLEELNRLKSFFVSSVSHELQTPLTSIKMFAELLRTKKTTSEQEKQEYLEIIEGESDRLTRLINNVLDYSRIERGIKEYSFKSFSLKELLEKVSASITFLLKKQGFKFTTEFPDHDVTVHADEDALHEALANLLSNAIKYSTVLKEIRFVVKVEEKSILFSIHDRGIGISQEEKDKIFDIFYRSTDSFVQATGGAGLGLTIVQHIVKAHNASIEVKSTPGKGSTFTIILPRRE